MVRRKTHPGMTVLDAVVAVLILGGILIFMHRVQSEIHYKWNWQAIPQYLFRYDSENDAWVSNILMQGLFTTIRLSIWGTLLAMIIGTVMGLFRTGRSYFNRLLAGAYVEIVRNLPPLVLIFIFYYFIGDQILPWIGMDRLPIAESQTSQHIMTTLAAPPHQLPRFLSAAIAIAVYEGAYITEIVRSGIQSIEPGQWEASRALGFTRWQQMRFIILPQAFKRILPPLTSQFISTIKDSAIVSVISIRELTFQGMELMATTYMTFEIWITVTGLYLVLTLPCSLMFRSIEKRWQRP